MNSKNTFAKFLLIISIHFGISLSAFPFTHTYPAAISDTVLTTDTLDIEEQFGFIDTSNVTSERIEKYIPVKPIMLMGSVDEDIDKLKLVTNTEIQTGDSRFLYDISENFPGVINYSLSSTGNSHPFIINRLDNRSIGVLNNGILLNDPLIGTYNLHLFPIDDVYRIEFISSAKSFIYGLNGTGGIVNLVSKNFPEGIRSGDAAKLFKPYSKIRYSETAYEETFLDGMLSQNILHNLNLTGGIQRVSADGRFTNSAYDSWNVRIKLRYNLSDNFNIYLSEIYNQNKLGLNGGIDLNKTPDNFIFDRIQAVVKNSDAYEKIARNDLQLGIAARLLPNTNSITKLTFYLSNQMRAYTDKETNSNQIFIKQKHHSRWMGVKFNQKIGLLPTENSFNRISFDIGSEIQSRQILQSSSTGYQASTLFSIFGIVEITPIKSLICSGFARLDNYLNQQRIGSGGDVQFTLTESINLYTGYSRSYRFPTFQELFWRDSTVKSRTNDFEPEKHQLYEIGLKFKIYDFISLNINFFNRQITNQIQTKPFDFNYPFPALEFIVKEKVKYNGINTIAAFHLWKFWGKGNFSYNFDINNSDPFPKYFFTGEVFFNDQFFRDHLNLKIGIRGRAISEQKGFEFNPQVGQLVPSFKYKIGSVGNFDAILLAKIGQATIHFVLENVLDNQYAILTYYPILDRSLRFGINWEFEN